MSAIILDTETNDMKGYPIEIAYIPCSFIDGLLTVDKQAVYDEYFSCPEPISYGAMAVHHILESDIAGKPSFETFRAPACEYIIGHNIDYDIEAIRKADPDFKAKAICTLALARMVYPDEAHNISALIYMLTKGSIKARESIRNAHNAKQDVLLTAIVLKDICLRLGIKDMQSLYLFSEQARIPTHITFGKHKGAAIKDIPSDYVSWLLKQSDLDPYLKKALIKG
ncbi:exonuclease domain-containing protein [Acinetobacter soli]|uniref:exonuclease domain-containing protein n=1 Tax=Acinetobacter soli TaxID=487316 RepID=UPI001F1C07C8|nr:exonuclease domain-containing protein [Acinetobacter soli]MCE6006378.1 DUF3820 family protein [Acinetobacter soli]